MTAFHLRLADIVKDGERYRLSIVEQKTKKARTFTVPLALYQFVRCYCLDHGIPAESIIFPLTERAVQKHLKLVCDYLGYQGISTHSFRKFYATEIYKNSGYNIALVQQLLQHSSAAVTQRYIGIQQQELEQAIEGHLILLRSISAGAVARWHRPPDRAGTGGRLCWRQASETQEAKETCKAEQAERPTR